MPIPMKFLRQINRGGTSDYPIAAIERALSAHGVPGITNDGPLTRLAGRVVARTPLARHALSVTRTTFLVPIMGPCFYRFLPFVVGARTIPLAHDCWEPEFDRWATFLRRADIRHAFFTARQSAEAMNRLVPGLRAEWLPEGIASGFFDRRIPLAARSIDILELGRRSAIFHDAIRDHCEARGYRHRFQRSPTDLVFPTRDAFRTGMADTKLLVCFPSSLTNPERSGPIETLTLRYLEGMACGSVLLGHAPSELIDLFGYNPVIEADPADPTGQIDRLLAAIDDQRPLIERNAARLDEIGTWDVRIGDMLQRLARDGIVPARP